MLATSLKICSCLLGVLVIGLVTSGCARAAIVQEDDVTYGKAGDRELKLDLARPEGEGPFPAIVFIHGGGWRGGNRQRWKSACTNMANAGFVAVTVTYRLTEPDKNDKATNPWPAQVNDVKCAVRWLRANAAKYKVDPDRIGACGDSAGGHLSLLLGLTDSSAGLEGDGGNAEQSSRVQAVVNIYGPTDMTELYRTSDGAGGLVKSFLGGTPDEVADTYRSASPLSHVSKDDCPVLTLHGTDDKLVPPEQAKLLDKRMTEAGASHTLMLLEGQGHGFQGEAAGRAMQAAMEFLGKHLKQTNNN